MTETGRVVKTRSTKDRSFWAGDNQNMQFTVPKGTISDSVVVDEAGDACWVVGKRDVWVRMSADEAHRKWPTCEVRWRSRDDVSVRLTRLRMEKIVLTSDDFKEFPPF
jgi:hypothetical protein